MFRTKFKDAKVDKYYADFLEQERFDKYKAIAEKRGGQLLCKKEAKHGARLTLRCERGHIWDAYLTNFRQGGWCGACLRKNYSIMDCQKIAEARKGKCLSVRFKTTKKTTEKLEWQCQHGHTWKASVSSVHYCNSWCLSCYIDQLKCADTKITPKLKFW